MATITNARYFAPATDSVTRQASSQRMRRGILHRESGIGSEGVVSGGALPLADAAQRYVETTVNDSRRLQHSGVLEREGKVDVRSTAADAVKLDFLRFEFKYVLNPTLRERVEGDLRYFMTLDPFVVGQPNGNYVVRSLYYDDPAFSSYYEKIDGALRRAKFRLRTYTSDPGATCATYLEIKGRYNSLVYKHRAAIDDAAGSRIFADRADTTSRILDTIADSRVATQFKYELARKRVEPVMLIDYVRRPYFSKYDPEFRLTFDEQLYGTATNRLFPDPSQNRRRLVPSYTVMEIKFKDRIPLWFHRIITNYGLQRKSISKVCKGIEAWKLAPQLD